MGNTCFCRMHVDGDGLAKLKRFLQHFRTITGRFSTMNIGGPDTQVHLGSDVNLSDVIQTIQDIMPRCPTSSRPR